MPGRRTDDQLLIGVNWKVSEFDQIRMDPEQHYAKVLAECAPEFNQRVRQGKRVDEFVCGFGHNCFRKPYGPGWALVGDAGASYEFTSAHGITNAFRQAANIAEAIDEGLVRRRPMMDALSEFEHRRNEVEGAFL